MEQEIKQLIESIEKVNAEPEKAMKLPDNTFFLDRDKILCKTRKKGMSRYPYSCDGLSMWTTDGGYITATESDYTVFRTCFMDEPPCVGFYMGIKNSNGEYFPVSATTCNAQIFEPYKIERYTVFTPAAAYYIAKCSEFTFAVRAYMSKSKAINFSLIGINNKDTPLEIYFCSYFEALLRFSEAESHWDASGRLCRRYDNGNFIITNNHEVFSGLAINSKITGNLTGREFATCFNDYVGQKGRGYSNSACLKSGNFPNHTTVSKDANKFPMAVDMPKFVLEPGKTATADYRLHLSHDEAYAFAEAQNSAIPADNWDAEVAALSKESEKLFDDFSINFENWLIGKNSPQVLNNFLRTVSRQIQFCATGNSYAGSYLGVRDVFQQLEAAVIWDRVTARKCIVRAFNYIDESGRPPRQFAISSSEKLLPAMDLREFIDQGLWLVDTVYTYISYTGDYSILDEQCKYYKFPPNVVYGRVWASSKPDDSLLCHLINIMNFLISNIDSETSCLKVLFGDWNDALDGLGKTKKEGQKYGNGVTVMGTLQFYRNLKEMCEILENTGTHTHELERYRALRTTVKEGFFKNCVQEKDGVKRIVHGWGDERTYYVGSFCDPDNNGRISFAPNAFYAISGMVESDDSLKSTAIRDILSLESKYGLKTLYPAFTPDMRPLVGRIANTTPGCAENDCAYVHASMFSIMALFIMGESERAWRELEKSIVISHDNPTLSTFVMPNSYLYNPDLGLDGESAGDWYTGSGTVLIKGMIKYAFGIRPTLDKLYIELPRFMPTDKVSVNLKVRDCALTLTYENCKNGKREYFINGEKAETVINPISNTERIILEIKDLPKELSVSVKD